MIVSFGTNIAKLWKQGKLKPVKYGLYGGKLTIANCTREHLKPKSLGGDSFMSNIALATKHNNNIRGNRPLKDFLTYDMAERYLEQFINIKLPEFNGIQYIKRVGETIGRLLK